MIRKILYLSCAVMLLGLSASYAEETPVTTQTTTPAIEVKTEKAVYPLDYCVVSKEKFGGDMGKPVDYNYNGRDIKFCCKGCVKDFEKSPDKFIEKIDKAIIDKEKPNYPLQTCVVSGEKLNAKDNVDVDYVYNNQLVRFCCKMCISDFKKDPEKYLSKLAVANPSQDSKSSPETK